MLHPRFNFLYGSINHATNIFRRSSLIVGHMTTSDNASKSTCPNRRLRYTFWITQNQVKILSIRLLHTMLPNLLPHLGLSSVPWIPTSSPLFFRLLNSSELSRSPNYIHAAQSVGFTVNQLLKGVNSQNSRCVCMKLSASVLTKPGYMRERDTSGLFT